MIGIKRKWKNGRLVGVHIATSGKHEAKITWNKKGEAIMCPNNLFEDGLILYAVYNSKQKDFVVYAYHLDITKKDYDTNCENKRYYEKCMKNIEWCNWVIKNCSNPISEEAVAYNSRPRGDYRTGTDSSGSGMTGSVSISSSTLDVPKVSERNPNYDPDKVAEAKRLLPLWQQEKAATEAKLK